VKSAAGAQHGEARGHLIGENGKDVPGGSSPLRPPLPVSRPVKPEFSPTVLKRISSEHPAIGDVVASIMGRRRWWWRRKIRPVSCGGCIRSGRVKKVLVFSVMESQGQLLWEADRSDVIQNRICRRV